MINEISGVALQLIGFSLIPLIAYLITTKKQQGFFNYIGLKKSNWRANLLALFLALILGLPFIVVACLLDDFRAIMLNAESIPWKFREMGFGLESVIFLVLTAVVKTAFTEEILFRGFVAKRLIALTNFRTGNLIQSVLFGLIHTLLFLTITTNTRFLFAAFLFPAICAYVSAFINEKEANGSIVPGWILHATANLISFGFFSFFGSI